MTWITALLKDRRRRQRGSVLSGVLIMTAFIAVIAGALMTELSTNFLLSRNLVNRVADEATINSAVELALNQMQTTPLNGPCPAPIPVTLNSRSAVATYVSCWPTVDVRSPQFRRIASTSAPFSIDGTHAQMSGLNDYLVGNSGGTLYDFTFGFITPRWSLALGGAITGPPLVIPDPHIAGQFLDVIPLSGPGCSPSTYCLSVRSDNGSSSAPSAMCSIPVNAPVVSQPASASSSYPGLVYFAAGTTLEAVDVSTGGTQCDWEATATVSGGKPILAGPLTITCGTGCSSGTDMIYAVASDAGSSSLVHYSYRNGLSQAAQPISGLPANALGLALSGSTLPAKFAMTFGGGTVALAQLASDGDTSVGPSRSIGSGIGGAPYWCSQCGNLIGVGGRNGGLYLFDSSLNPYASFAGPAPISTAPGADGGGNWYYGADDGYVYEVQVLVATQTMSLATRYGPMATVGSSVQVGGCPSGICVYLGGLDNNAYMIPLDARDAVLSACITVSPPGCSGENPKLWASVEVGANALQTVHVQGWSYYSP